MRTAFPSLLAASVVLLLSLGCEHASEPDIAAAQAGDLPANRMARAATADAPIIVVRFDAGMPADPDSRSSGIRLAVWEDGTVLVASDPLHPDREMRVGRLGPDELASALSDLDRAGFFTHPETVLVAPDSASVRVTARSAASTRTHALDTYYQSQVDWWPAVIAALERLRPAEVRPVDDGTFRGYVLAE